MKKVLVVDDEATLAATVRYNLEREGYEVTVATDGEAAIEAARAHHPDVVILDLMLPIMDGLEVCRVLRRESSAPIIMLTAKASEIDKVVGLELGADDYVTKPFGMRELIARVRALLRRTEAPTAGEVDSVSSGDLRIDLRRREAFRADVTLPLKPKEMELLTFFLRNRGRVFTRDQLLSQIWGYDYAANTRTIDVHVRWLRQKIEENADTPRRILTVRGTGYRFDG